MTVYIDTVEKPSYYQLSAVTSLLKGCTNKKADFRN